jgi:hypothetical protein
MTTGEVPDFTHAYDLLARLVQRQTDAAPPSIERAGPSEPNERDRQGTGAEPSPQGIEIAFYDCERETDHLVHKTVDAAVEYRLDERDTDFWPEVLTVYAFAREVISAEARKAFAESAAQNLYDDLDEYIGPDGHTIHPRDYQTAHVFVDTVLHDFVPWSCREVAGASVEVNVASWIREKKPEWADDAATLEWMRLR